MMSTNHFRVQSSANEGFATRPTSSSIQDVRHLRPSCLMIHYFHKSKELNANNMLSFRQRPPSLREKHRHEEKKETFQEMDLSDTVQDLVAQDEHTVSTTTYFPECSRIKEVPYGEQARLEWEKFAKVDECLRLFNAYRACYKGQRRTVSRMSVGSRGEQSPRQPVEYASLNQTNGRSLYESQRDYLLKRAKATELYIRELGEMLRVTLGRGVVKRFRKADLKTKERINCKCKSKYGGDVRRVLDLARCELVLSKKHANKSKLVVSVFHPTGPLGNKWEVVRVKDGFERAADGNFLEGGYCDIKINLLCRATNHIIELQVHLETFHRIGQKNDGHKTYEFARQQSIPAMTNAAQIMERDFTSSADDVFREGFKDLQMHKNREERARIMARLGHLNRASGRRTLAICWYMRALRSSWANPQSSFLFRAEVSTALCSCVAGQLLAGEDPKSRREKLKREWAGSERDRKLWEASFKYSSLWRVRCTAIYTKYCLGIEHPLTLRAKAVKAEVLLATYPSKSCNLTCCISMDEHCVFNKTLYAFFSQNNRILRWSTFNKC